LSRQINKVSLEHSIAWQHLSDLSVVEKWTPPPSSTFKINFDTAIRDTFSAQAAVCRDDHGQINKMDTQISPPCHPNMGEALAAKLASQLTLSLHLTCFILEGDSQIVILALQHSDIAQD